MKEIFYFSCNIWTPFQIVQMAVLIQFKWEIIYFRGSKYFNQNCTKYPLLGRVHSHLHIEMSVVHSCSWSTLRGYTSMVIAIIIGLLLAFDILQGARVFLSALESFLFPWVQLCGWIFYWLIRIVIFMSYIHCVVLGNDILWAPVINCVWKRGPLQLTQVGRTL